VREEIKTFSAWPTIPQVGKILSWLRARLFFSPPLLTLPPSLPISFLLSPSYPFYQCFINGEFVGGSDILLEMYESGELEKTLAELKK